MDALTSHDAGPHAVRPSKNGKAKLPRAKEVGVRGRAFVIVADGKRCYRGAFWVPASSISCPTPVILLDEGRAGNVIHIRRAYPTDKFAEGADPRGDARLLKVLRDLGRLAEPPANSR